MKRLLLLTTTLLMLMSADANQVSEQEALVKAQQFFSKASLPSATRGRAPRKAPELKLVNSRSEFFAFNDEANGGYVIVSGDERMPDVLAYSYDGSYDTDNMPCNMKAWMEQYARQVNYLRAHPEAKMTKRAATERDNINPLLTCHFDQDAPYNNKCPEVDGKHCLTGSDATAMAMIMYYWQWPKQTTEVIPGYITDYYKLNMPAIPITTIDWDNILGEYDSREINYTEKQVDAVSTLMLLCGTSVERDYSPYESDSGFPRIVLWKYFGYDELAEEVDRSDFDINEWEQLMYNELKNGRPVYYWGRNDFHKSQSFVLDGYENGYFHVGWGLSESYVLMTDTEGWEGYSFYQSAIIGIQPEYPNSPCRYGVFDNGKMTLYYDNKKASRSGTILHLDDLIYYNLFSGYQIDPSLVGLEKRITECVIDPSFANLKLKALNRFFCGWENLKSIKGLENLNTSSVKNMNSMFYGCSSLTSLDLSGFKTDNVKDLSYMFYYCSNLTSLDVSGFKTDNVTDMKKVFSGCSSLTSLDVSGFKTDNVTDMSYMFQYCSSLTSLDLSGFKTDNVTNMEYMFNACSGLTNLDVSGFKTDNVWNMSSMFERCSSLTSLDVSGFKTDKVWKMEYMFLGCSSLTSLDLSGFKTDNVRNMSFMFNGCSSLTSLDLSSFMAGRVTDMSYMFEGCNHLSTIYVSELWNMSKVEESGDMFYSCTNIVGGAGTTYDENHTDGEYARVDGGPDNPGYFTYKEIPDAICTITPDLQVVRIYNLQGKRLDRARKGLNIIHTSKGVKKIVVK